MGEWNHTLNQDWGSNASFMTLRKKKSVYWKMHWKTHGCKNQKALNLYPSSTAACCDFKHIT